MRDPIASSNFFIFDDNTLITWFNTMQVVSVEGLLKTWVYSLSVPLDPARFLNKRSLPLNKRRNSAKFWLGLQDDYDIEEEGLNKKKELDGIATIEQNAT